MELARTTPEPRRLARHQCCFEDGEGIPQVRRQRSPDRAEQRENRLNGAQVLVGRSFGGRVCARLAVEEPRRAVVLLGFPIRPPGKSRPLDEAALRALRCPTLILQGSEDELGSPEILRQVLGESAFVTLEIIDGAGHAFGKHEAAVIARTAQWLSQRLAHG